MASSMLPTDKLSIQAYLRMLTAGGCTMEQAMSFTNSLYKSFSTPEELSKLSTLKLEAMGLAAPSCKLIMAAVRKAGYKPPLKAKTPAPPKKRKRDSDLDSPLPSTSADARNGPAVDLSFDEVLDEEVLSTKATVINRAPVMSAWAMVVCERLGFQRAEALSIGSAYTEMNAITKGVSVGVFDSSKGKGVELSKDDSQPYVDLMGRRIPVMKASDDTWRALVKNEPVDPAEAHGYIKRAFRQTTPHVLGAMRLLARAFVPSELNERGYSLYAEFRPPAGQWGSRSEMKISNILALRNGRASVETADAAPVVSLSENAHTSADADVDAAGPSSKRRRREDQTLVY